MGTKFTTRYENECAYCHGKFFSKVKRAMYCSPLCKGRALAKPKKQDSETGMWHKVCTECGIEFDSNIKNTRMCPACRRKKASDACKKWQKNHPDWQKNWNRENPEKIKKSKHKWEAKNPDKVAAMKKRHDVRKAEKREEKRRERAIEKQNEMAASAIRYKPAQKLDQNEFLDSLGLIRITANECLCTRCNNQFFVSMKETSAYRNLKNYSKKGTSPCPYCGETPIRNDVSNSGSVYEHEIMKEYPNFTERHFRPDFMEGKEIDLYDPVARVGLEFHGIWAHSDRRHKGAWAHKKKADMAEKAGIQLIQLYESEWVQRKECVMDKLDAIFHRNMLRIPARKLKVKILLTEKEHEMACRFMDENHIQGHSSFQWGVALMDSEGPVAVCTFRYGTGYAAGGHVENTGRYWELNRYATRLHTAVQGGLSRCISKFWGEHPDVSEVFSFADRRWTCTTRSAYASSGFVEVDMQEPNYQYTNLDPKAPLRNKQFMRKSNIRKRSPEVYSDSKTELEMAHELGFYRIYDAGKIKYKMSKPQ